MTMAVAAAGGGLLTAAAGAAPAYAAAPAAPPGGRTVTITAHPTAQATSGISPHINGEDLPPSITCWLTAPAPQADPPQGNIQATARVHCNYPVDFIGLYDFLSQDSTTVGSDLDQKPNSADALTTIYIGPCQQATYINFASARIDFPAEYSPSPGYLHHSASFVGNFSSCLGGTLGGGGGGGGGGCAVITPSPSAHPAARRPNVISCP
jgi:hypothetical protein